MFIFKQILYSYKTQNLAIKHVIAIKQFYSYNCFIAIEKYSYKHMGEDIYTYGGGEKPP